MKLKSKKPLTEEEVIQARERLFELKSIQEKAREEELEIREYLVARLYPSDKEEGSTTVTVGSVKLALEKKFNRSITAAEADRLKQEHPELEAEVLSWRPSVKNGVYLKNRDVMDNYITTSAAPSTVQFK